MMKNETELIGNAKHFIVLPSESDATCGDQGIKIDDSSLEKSGLSDIEIDHLKCWVEGKESGRCCMLAILDSKHTADMLEGDADANNGITDLIGNYGSGADCEGEVSSSSSSSSSSRKHDLDEVKHMALKVLCSSVCGLPVEFFASPPVNGHLVSNHYVPYMLNLYPLTYFQP